MIRKFKNNVTPNPLLREFIDTSEEIVIVQDRFVTQSEETKRKQAADSYEIKESPSKNQKAKSQVVVPESVASKLVQAARLGAFQEVQELISEKKADVNAIVCNWTSLLYASFYGRAEMINLLLQAGADVNKASTNGTTPLMSAVEQKHTESVKVILQSPSLKMDLCDQLGETALHKAIKVNSLTMVELLVDKEADINFIPPKESMGQSAKGNAVLHEAIARGHEDIVRYLLECGADVNLLCKGATPIHRAVSKTGALVKVLLEWDADPSIQETNTQRNALHLACFHGQYEAVKALCERDGGFALTKELDKFQKTPKDIAVQKGLLLIVHYLEELQKKASEEGAEIENSKQEIEQLWQ